MPSYYETSSGYQAKDLIKIAIEPLDGIIAFYTGNMIKYACRWWRKGGVKDLEKIKAYSGFIREELSKDPKPLDRMNFADRIRMGNSINDISSKFAKDFYGNYYVVDNESLYRDLIAVTCLWFWNGFSSGMKKLDVIDELCDKLIFVLNDRQSY